MGPKGMRGPIAKAALLAFGCARFAGECCQIGATLADLGCGERRIGQRGEGDLRRQGRCGGRSGNKGSSSKSIKDTGHGSVSILNNFVRESYLNRSV